VTFTAAVVGAPAPVEFKWLVSDGVSSTVASEWSTTATFAWTPTTTGVYSVTVWARAAGNSADEPEQTATMTFSIKGKAKKERR
jgi:hypothetical protein